MNKSSLGDLWPLLFFTVMGIVSIVYPFLALAEKEDPIDSVTEVIAAAGLFVMLIPVGVYCIWVVVSCVVAELLASFWWGHLKEGMRKEDVLHILGEPNWRNEDGTDILGRRKTTWHYCYRWFTLRGYVEFGANDTVTLIGLPRGKPEERYPGEWHGW